MLTLVFTSLVAHSGKSPRYHQLLGIHNKYFKVYMVVHVLSSLYVPASISQNVKMFSPQWPSNQLQIVVIDERCFIDNIPSAPRNVPPFVTQEWRAFSPLVDSLGTRF